MFELKFPAVMIGVYLTGVLADATPEVTEVFGKFGIIGGITIVSTLGNMYVINLLLKNQTDEQDKNRTERAQERVLAEQRIKMLSEMAVSITRLADAVNNFKKGE